jgi:hypothetical protein
MTERIDLLNNAESYVGSYFSQEWVAKNILKFNDEEIKDIEQQIRKEKSGGDFVSDDDEAFGQEYAASS